MNTHTIRPTVPEHLTMTVARLEEIYAHSDGSPVLESLYSTPFSGDQITRITSKEVAA